ncbi:hypothetical protein N9C96_00295 [bacterium]|nr:hypothetical protein [bacterium]
MPNTIYTSALASIGVIAMTGTVMAEAACFARTYTDDHLAKNPAQVVRHIRMLLSEDPRYDGIPMDATMANQGHVAGTEAAGRTLTQGLFCLQDSDALRCGVDCDGGMITVTRQDAEVLEFETDYLVVGDREHCGGTANLAEVEGEMVTYRLFRVELDQCEGL